MSAGPQRQDYDTVVIGGGFFGCSLAAHLSEKGSRVALVERNPTLLARASYANQARVHNGYHYPRSLLTALRSRVNYQRFLKDYAPCIRQTFTHHYAVPRAYSKVNAAQFRRFMERIGAPIKPAGQVARKIFNPDLIEEVFEVEECAFDSLALQKIALDRLEKTGVDYRLGTEVTAIVSDGRGLEVTCSSPEGQITLGAGRVLNCTYSRINNVLSAAGLAPVKLKHEITEMALAEVPEELRERAITVMCGPFFSLMPFPPRGLHTLSHVRYTPHCSWQEGPGLEVTDPYAILADYPKRSRFEAMKRDSARYVPLLGQLAQRDSLWEVKTVLPQSEADDSRPILFQQAEEDPRVWCIMGGKIDNIYDAAEQLDERDGAEDGGQKSEVRGQGSVGGDQKSEGPNGAYSGT